MSGTKTVQARLDRRLQRDVEREVARSRRRADRASESAALEGRLQASLVDVERLLARDDIVPALRVRLEAFRAGAVELVATGQELRRLFDETARLATLRRPTAETVAGLQALDARAEAAAASREHRARELEAEIGDIENSLAAEESRLATRAAIQDRRRRRTLLGLQEAWRAAMCPDAACTLAGLPDAVALGRCLDDLLASDRLIEDSQVTACHGRLDALVAEAESAERARRERQAVFDAFDRALHDAGFTLAFEPSWTPEAVRARHVGARPELRGVVDTEVNSEGRIRVEMRGPSGDGLAVLGALERCDVGLARLAALARAHGLIIVSALHKGPDGWQALTLPEADGEQAGRVGQANRHDRTMEVEP